MQLIAMALLLRRAQPLRHVGRYAEIRHLRRAATRRYAAQADAPGIRYNSGPDREDALVRPGTDYAPLTAEELIPKSNEMMARAQRVKATLPERFVAPEEAAEMVRVGAALIDVRTEEQVLTHEVIEGTPALTARNARRVALDNWVIAGGPPPMLGGGGRRVVLACTAGPKSALAVEYLLEYGVDAVAVAGGLKAWGESGLELVDAFAADEDEANDEDEDD